MILIFSEGQVIDHLVIGSQVLGNIIGGTHPGNNVH